MGRGPLRATSSASTSFFPSAWLSRSMLSPARTQGRQVRGVAHRKAYHRAPARTGNMAEDTASQETPQCQGVPVRPAPALHLGQSATETLRDPSCLWLPWGQALRPWLWALCPHWSHWPRGSPQPQGPAQQVPLPGPVTPRENTPCGCLCGASALGHRCSKPGGTTQRSSLQGQREGPPCQGGPQYRVLASKHPRPPLLSACPPQLGSHKSHSLEHNDHHLCSA